MFKLLKENNMLGIIGLLLIIAGTIITAIATTQYQNSTSKKQAEIKKLSEENQKLGQQILGLSNRISEQSKFIENQITGGDAFAYSKLLKYSNGAGQTEYTLEVYNDFDYPIRQVQLHWLYIEFINNNCFIAENGKKLLNSECVSQYRRVININDLPEKNKNLIQGMKLPEAQMNSKYAIQYTTKNGKYFQKILVNKCDSKVIGFAYQIIKQGEVLKEFKDGKFDDDEINFVDGFEFVDEVIPYNSTPL